MTIIHVNLPHIQELISQGQAEIRHGKMSLNFAEYIEKNYPFIPVTGYSINWDNVIHKIRLRWDHATDQQVEDFIYSTTISDYQLVAVWYGRRQPCLVCHLSFAAENLDLLFASGAGARYMFGIKKKGESEENPAFFDFIEVYNQEWISGIGRSQN
jgi:hypothetical protein